MSSDYDKFKWWLGEIEKEESKLSYNVSKIFNSCHLLFKLLEKYNISGEGFSEIGAMIEKFTNSNSFEENIVLFTQLYKKSIEFGFFMIPLPYIETLERMRKTQYHIWQLFADSWYYNKLVRQYNDRRNWPSRYEIARKYGFREKPFIYDNSWYQGPSSVKMIGICGPSCSGKSTSCKSLRPYFGYTLIQLDRFFKKQPGGVCHGYPDWDIEESLMIDRLIACLDQLKHGEPTLIPSKGWTEDFNRLIYPKPIIVIEGFLLFLNNNITSFLDKRVFIDLSEENLLKRRINRDGLQNKEYTIKCVIPHYRKYRQVLLNNTELSINGEDNPAVIRNEIKKIIERMKSSV